MTKQITVPRETWDALREVLKLCYEHCRVYHPEVDTNNVGQSVRQALTAANAVSEPKVKLIPTAQEMGTPVQPQFVGCAYYESNGGCCESEEPCKADVQNNAVVQPQAQGEASKSQKTWCEYVAGVVCTYLNEPDNGDKYKAIAGIIERRLWALPAPDAGNPITESGWRPIETAPKDGSEILLGHPDGSMAVGWWREARSHGRVAGWSDGDDFAMTWPSHWKPKPAAPEAKQ